MMTRSMAGRQMKSGLGVSDEGNSDKARTDRDDSVGGKEVSASGAVMQGGSQEQSRNAMSNDKASCGYKNTI